MIKNFNINRKLFTGLYSARLRIAAACAVVLFLSAGCLRQKEEAKENETGAEQTGQADEQPALPSFASLPPSAVIDSLQLKAYGVDNCFSISPIDSIIRHRIEGKSFNETSPVDLEDLRYLTVLHVGFDGKTHKGEIVCHKGLAGDFIEVFRTLYENNYPIYSIRLVDDFDGDDNRSMAANNTSSYNARTVPGTTKLSSHAYGQAIDINPLYNPMIEYKGGKTQVLPPNGEPYVDRTRDFPYKITTSDLCCREFKRRGYRWGGDWTSMKDYQHFDRRL